MGVLQPELRSAIRLAEPCRRAPRDRGGAFSPQRLAPLRPPLLLDEPFDLVELRPPRAPPGAGKRARVLAPVFLGDPRDLARLGLRLPGVVNQRLEVALAHVGKARAVKRRKKEKTQKRKQEKTRNRKQKTKNKKQKTKNKEEEENSRSEHTIFEIA